MADHQENFAPTESKLILAIDADNANAVRTAIISGANANASGRYNMSPLMYAILNNKQNAISALLNAGADPNTKTINNETPMTLAVRIGRKNHTLIKMLLQKGGEANTLLPDGSPLLSAYVDSYDIEGVRLLSSYKANLNALSRTGTPLIIEAALMEAWDVVWVFIELGADYRVQQVRGNHRLDISRLLSNHGATPADSPIWPWKVKVWQYLKERGMSVPNLPKVESKGP